MTHRVVGVGSALTTWSWKGPALTTPEGDGTSRLLGGRSPTTWGLGARVGALTTPEGRDEPRPGDHNTHGPVRTARSPDLGSGLRTLTRWVGPQHTLVDRKQLVLRHRKRGRRNHEWILTNQRRGKRVGRDQIGPHTLKELGHAP